METTGVFGHGPDGNEEILQVTEGRLHVISDVVAIEATSEDLAVENLPVQYFDDWAGRTQQGFTD